MPAPDFTLRRIAVSAFGPSLLFGLGEGAILPVIALSARDLGAWVPMAALIAFKLLAKLRASGISADKDYLAKGIKAQFKFANKLNARYTVVIGDDEIEKNIVSLKDMDSGEQEEVSIDDLIEELGGKL